MFELKRYGSNDDTIAQIFRYVQSVQRWDYGSIERKLKAYLKNEDDKFSLKTYHQNAFELATPLNEREFNKKQKMIIIANSLDNNLKNSISYWQKKGMDIDFVPYRVYEIGKKRYFEIFTKPFDSHFNPSDIKGVIFDTNRAFDEKAADYMLKEKRVSSFWGRREAVYCLKKNDYVFLSHKSVGIIASGKVTSEVKKGDYQGDGSELYVNCAFFSDKYSPDKGILSYSRIQELIDKTFFHARIDKRPFLSAEESEKLIEEIA